MKTLKQDAGQASGVREVDITMVWNQKRDLLREKYSNEDVLKQAKELLQKDEQSEEAFLGAQGILMLHGLI